MLLTRTTALLIHNPNAQLKWSRYEQLCEEHGIELAGWPQDIPFGRMNMLSAKKCETLYKAIQAGTLQWKQKTSVSAASADAATNTIDVDPDVLQTRPATQQPEVPIAGVFNQKL